MISDSCPNCGHMPYSEKSHCEKCGFLKPKTNKLPDADLIFCKNCGCHYTSETGACPLHQFDGVEKVKLPVPPKPKS